ncbi:MAG: hypothetical protein GX652_09820, partial [Burkholderiaceae bacterium]|nr:hypothetical protein [Burkholderiaceae bacterium]
VLVTPGLVTPGLVTPGLVTPGLGAAVFEPARLPPAAAGWFPCFAPAAPEPARGRVALEGGADFAASPSGPLAA